MENCRELNVIKKCLAHISDIRSICLFHKNKVRCESSERFYGRLIDQVGYYQLCNEEETLIRDVSFADTLEIDTKRELLPQTDLHRWLTIAIKMEIGVKRQQQMRILAHST